MTDLADAEQMRSLVSELNALRISEFLTEEDPRIDPGPDGWEYRVVLTPADGGELSTVTKNSSVYGKLARDASRCPAEHKAVVEHPLAYGNSDSRE